MGREQIETSSTAVGPAPAGVGESVPTARVATRRFTSAAMNALRDALAERTVPGSLYRALADDRVECTACAHRCRLATGSRGICGVRFSSKAGATLFRGEDAGCLTHSEAYANAQPGRSGGSASLPVRTTEYFRPRSERSTPLSGQPGLSGSSTRKSVPVRAPASLAQAVPRGRFV